MTDGWVCSGIYDEDSHEDRLRYKIGCPICHALHLNKNDRLQRLLVALIFIGIGSIPIFVFVVAPLIPPSVLIGGALLFVVIIIPTIAVLGVQEALEAGRPRFPL